MARRNISEDQTTLQMALVGYEIEKERIEGKIREIHAQLKGKTSTVFTPVTAKQPRAKRELSPAARKRIAMAQKKRWAEHRKRLAQAAKEAEPR
jgi:hypothetical protein